MNDINFKNSTPKYQIVENTLVDRINQGFYSVGDSLPTETELAKEFECSRVTVRQALSNLQYKGYITKTQGSGSFIKKSKPIQRTPYLKSFTEDMIEMNKTPSNKINTFNITIAGDSIAKRLKIAADAKIYYIERTRLANDVPILFEKTFMSVDLHPEISVKILEGSKYQYAEDQKLYISYSMQTIDPIFPPEYIAKELKLPITQPIIRIKNTTYLRDGTVFDYTELYMNTDLYQLNIVKTRYER